MKVMIFFQCLFIRPILSQLQDFMRFNPKLGSDVYDVDVVKFAIDANKSSANGFSVCIRANFQIMNAKCIFKADENLELKLFDFQRGGGSINFKGVETYFQSDPDALDRLSTWQSYCIVYNPNPSLQVGYIFLLVMN